MIRVSQLNAPSCMDEAAITFGLILEYWIMMNAIDTMTNLNGYPEGDQGRYLTAEIPLAEDAVSNPNCCGRTLCSYSRPGTPKLLITASDEP